MSYHLSSLSSRGEASHFSAWDKTRTCCCTTSAASLTWIAMPVKQWWRWRILTKFHEVFCEFSWNFCHPRQLLHIDSWADQPCCPDFKPTCLHDTFPSEPLRFFTSVYLLSLKMPKGILLQFCPLELSVHHIFFGGGRHKPSLFIRLLLLIILLTWLTKLTQSDLQHSMNMKTNK